MPWNLTTPVNVGDLDTVDYSEITMTGLRHDSRRKMLMLEIEYGNTVDGEWKAGFSPANKQTNFILTDTEYDSVTAGSVPDVQTSDPGSPAYAQVGSVWVERTYVAVKRGCYEWLVAQGHIGAGSIS